MSSSNYQEPLLPIPQLDKLRGLLRCKVIPILPFLREKADRGDKTLHAKLNAISAGNVPNYPQWTATFNPGGESPYMVDQPINGVRIFTEASEIEARNARSGVYP